MRKAVRLVAVCGGMVCGDTVSYGCDGSSRAGDAALLGTHTDSVAPAGSGGPAPGVVGAAGTGDWLMPVATGSTMAGAVDGTGPAAGTDNRAVSAPTLI